MGFPRYFWHFFLVPGLLILLWACVDSYRVWSLQGTIGYTQGTVVRKLITGKIGVDFQAEIEFTPADGRKRTLLTSMSYSNALVPGRKVTVVYDLDDPDHAHIEIRPPHPWAKTIVLVVWGGSFALIGGIPLYFRVRKQRCDDWLKLNGRAIDADFTRVRHNTDLIVNGKSPYQIDAHWLDPATNQDYNFHSENLWTDPRPHLSSKVISVVIDPRDPKRYWMDVSFLPP